MESLADVYLNGIRKSLEIKLDFVNEAIERFNEDDLYSRGYRAGLIEQKEFLESMLFRNELLKVSQGRN